ncbi:MAG: phosphodiester glycosidase family protein [Verrucomicrobia bacterium]|nr:phosphodiester glycosidase family protein [Verrucomicrobiota bacterium]
MITTSFAFQAALSRMLLVSGCVATWLMLAVTSPVLAAEGAPEKGITYKNDRIESAPWSVHVVKVPRNDPTLEVRSTLARETVLGLSRVSDQALDVPSSVGTPLAGVNGDFYEREGSRYAGDPRGLQIVEGDLVSEPTGNSSYCAFWIDADGNPHIDDVVPQFKATFPGGKSFKFGLNEERGSGSVVLYTSTLGKATRASGGRELVLEKADGGSWIPFRIGETYTATVREANEAGNSRLDKSTVVLSFGPRRAADLPAIEAGMEITLSTASTPNLRSARAAISGGSIITRGGKKTKIQEPRNSSSLNSYSVRSMFERHPRSAVGFSKTHIFFATVDGRQRGLSVGMTLEELGAYMAKIGCEEAINLDGGGSATFWYRGRVVNSPCDGSERTVANGLLVIRKPVTAPGSPK